jgi:hypothetical protein
MRTDGQTMEEIVTQPSRISILLPVTFAVIWIALVCLAVPDFAAASTRAVAIDHSRTVSGANRQ